MREPAVNPTSPVSSAYAGWIIVRPAAEVATKSRRTRKRFEQTLRDNLRAALNAAGVPHRLHLEYGGLLVETAQVADALGVLPRVFGIAGFSPVEALAAPELDAIVETGRARFAETVKGRTYAVRARRLGGAPFRAQDVNIRLGAALNDGATVDLSNPDVTVHVEVHEGRAMLFTERRAGAGGLPAGVQGRVLTLLSGGFDSAVAAWRIMRRGAASDFVLFNLGGAAFERVVIQIAKLLSETWAAGQRPRLFVVDFAAPVDEIRARVRPAYWQVVLKRDMYRAAAAVAAETGAEALVTGEAIGQVSTQTVSNLRAIEAVTDLPVLRPLIATDKQEIVDEAWRIGTAKLSERVKEYCAIAPGRPVVASTPERVAREEADMDPAVLAAAVAARREVDVDAITPDELRTAYLYTREIPEGAQVIDVRGEDEFAAWHVPGAVRYDEIALMEDFERLDKDRTYVLYCARGGNTPLIAEVMQQFGYDAYAFEGGINAVRRAVEDARRRDGG